MKKFLILSLLLFLSVLPFKVTEANSSDVVINEIAWMGTKIDGIESKNWWRYEWLELYNNTTNPISLDNWKIELYRTDLDYTISLKGEIPANGYFLVVASDKIVNYDFNYSNLAGKLNNSGQKVVLKNSVGEIIDEIDCFSAGKWFAGDNTTKQTMERISPLVVGNISSNWQSSQNPGGTPHQSNFGEGQAPKAENQITEEQISENPPEARPLTESLTGNLTEARPLPIYPGGIVFNEILPSPEGADETEEWIEIFNGNNFEVDLSGWKIKDGEGGTKTYIFPAGVKIAAKGYLVLTRPVTKIILNNTGDKLALLQPDDKIIDEVIFEKAPRNQSYSKKDGKWYWTSFLTPGKENKISEENSKNAKTETKENTNPLDKKQLLSSLNQGVLEFKNFIPAALIALAIAIFAVIIIILFLNKKNKNQL